VAVKRFEDLRVWQLARELTRGVYRACTTQRLRKDEALAGQMRRSAISIVSNIAEGYERGTRKQQIEACYLARGSAGELRAQILIAHDLGLLDDNAFKWLHERAESVSRMLSQYIAYLKRSESAIRGDKYAPNAGKPGAPDT
jgi:four helix bundle protein